jgi:hypothetical protein
MEFGNPSSHTYGAAFTIPTLCWLFVQHYKARYQTTIGWNIRLPLYTFLFIILCVLGFSRVFKGVHTYNQVLSGFVQGILLTLIQVFVFYEDYFKFYVSIKYRSFWRLIFNRFMLVYCVLFGLGVYQHFDTQENFKVPEEWIENVVRQCGVENKINIDPETANFQKFFLSLSIFGIYLGVIIDQQVLDTGKYAFFYETDLQTTIKRCILTTLCNLPCVAPLLMS